MISDVLKVGFKKKKGKKASASISPLLPDNGQRWNLATRVLDPFIDPNLQTIPCVPTSISKTSCNHFPGSSVLSYKPQS